MRGEQPFGRFANNDEVQVRGARIGQHPRQARYGADRPHPGIEAEFHAQFDLRRNLGAVGIADARQPHRRQQDRIGLAGGGECGARQRFPGLGIASRAAGKRLELQRESAGPVGGGPQQLGAGRGDLLADAVAREGRYAKYPVGHVGVRPCCSMFRRPAIAQSSGAGYDVVRSFGSDGRRVRPCPRRPGCRILMR